MKLMRKGTTTDKHPTPAVWIATAGGAGYFPVAPGTVGSAVGVGVVAALDAIPIAHGWRTALLCLTVFLFFFIGVWAAGRSEKFFGRTDPGHVIIDEVAGQMVAFLLSPHASWKVLVAGFALFRLFDIVKLFPAGRAERLARGWGIMVDDVIAGAYAMVALVLLGNLIR